MKTTATYTITVTLPRTLMGKLMPILRMSEQVREVAGETWKELGVHLVSLPQQWLWLVSPDLRQANTEVFDSSRDSHLVYIRNTYT